MPFSRRREGGPITDTAVGTIRGEGIPSSEETSASESLKQIRQNLIADTSLVGEAFCLKYSDEADRWLKDLFEKVTGSDSSKMAMIAVGGYGRRELCPGSDLDVVVIHHPRLRQVKKLADAIWYPVWDQGIHLDHSVRTPKQMLSMASEDLKVLLGLLDGRLIAGQERLAAPVFEKAQQLWAANAADLIPKLRESVALRHADRGDVAFLLEPDIKEDRGGLRDLHAINCSAKSVPVVRGSQDSPELREANLILLSARVELHRRSDKEANQLLLQEQDPVAESLGYPDADALMAAIATAGRAIAWAGDDCWRRSTAWLAGPKGRAGGSDRQVDRGLVVRDGEIGIAPGFSPADDCSLALRCAVAAAEIGVPISRAALVSLADLAPAPSDPWPDNLLQSLVALLGMGHSAIGEIEALDQQGIFVRIIPEWQAVRNRPQRNAFHRFTVDRHLCEAAAQAAAFVREVSRPDLLLIGALLHDIGKGFPGDHTKVGMQVVETIATRMGFPEEDVKILVSMVQYHLLLADTASKRDLDDPATIDMVVGMVGNSELLLLLSALTQADSMATGPAASSPWKMRMISSLVRKTLNRLVGMDSSLDEETAGPDHQLDQLGDIVKWNGRPAVRNSILPDGDGWELKIAAPDKPGLLASVAGVLALHGLAVRSATAGDLGRSVARETFLVEPKFGREPNWEQLEEDLAMAIDGKIDLDARLQAKANDYAGIRRPGAANTAEPLVLVDNDASERATVLEVRAPDGIGVLYKITSALSKCNLDIVSAKVLTLGHEVVDNFYVRRIVDGQPEKIVERADLDAIERSVISNLS